MNQPGTDELTPLVEQTREAFRLNPARARVRFSSSSRQESRFCSQVSIRQHRLLVDEPPAIGGADAGPNPIELVLAALGTCQEITWRAFATAMGIPLTSVSVTVHGDIDLGGFFGVAEGVRAGCQAIEATVHVDSPASDADLARLRAAVDAHCPVLDMLTTPVPVRLHLAREPAA